MSKRQPDHRHPHAREEAARPEAIAATKPPESITGPVPGWRKGKVVL